MYCKCLLILRYRLLFFGINSSKVYCKFINAQVEWKKKNVLIVAKCIVNHCNTFCKLIFN